MTLLCSAGLMMASSGCTLLPKEKAVLKPPLTKPQKVAYNLYEVKRTNITRQLKGTGTFESTRIVSQEFKGIPGRIAAVHVKKGDAVKKGDILIELEDQGQDIDVLEKERDMKKAELSLELAKENHDTRAIPIRMLELGIAGKKLEEARKQRDGRTMTAGADGIIVSMEQVRPGDSAQPGKSYLTIADPNSLRLAMTTAASAESREVQIGMKAEIAYKNQKLDGTVTQSPSSTPQTNDKQLSEKNAQTIYLKLADGDTGTVVTPEWNASADIVIVLQRKENAVVIPRTGLYAVQGRTYVKVREGETIREVDVEKGLETQTDIEIVKGLQEGQTIILQ